jgi:glycosyltransferase involved in cell wall biosynthesis
VSPTPESEPPATNIKVSILMACYNAEAFVAEAIESLLSQSFTNSELVVVDDSSTDGSPAIVSRYVRSNVMLLKQKKSGATVARNAAFRQSRGQYFIFLDADDVFTPSHLEALVECASRHPDCIALSRWDRFFAIHQKPGFLRGPLKASMTARNGWNWTGEAPSL